MEFSGKSLSFRPHFFFSPDQPAQALKSVLSGLYEDFPLSKATHGIVVGGDGWMLHTLHSLYEHDNKAISNHVGSIPLYGINCGTVGFLLNHVDKEKISQLSIWIERSVSFSLAPLNAEILLESGETILKKAINEVTLMRESSQACILQIHVNKQIVLEQLIGDGVLVSTPAGSGAYNFSAGGPILPLNSRSLAVTPLHAFRPRRWPGAILSDDTYIELKVQKNQTRPVYTTVDSFSIARVVSVKIFKENQNYYSLLFDPDHHLDQRIIQEQFIAYN